MDAVHEDLPQKLQWPGPYGAHITRLLGELPQVERIFTLINTPFEVQTSSGPETVQGDSATIFGGFLRWVVGEVSSGRTPTLSKLIAEGSDIDIAVEDFTGERDEASCHDRLLAYFRDLIRDGCVIEYAGMTYGSDSMVEVNIDVTRPRPILPYGSYMVWVPINTHDSTVNTVNTNSTLVIRLRRPGFSFADAVKSHPVGCTDVASIDPTHTESTHTPANSVVASTEPARTECGSAQKWIRLDINYGQRLIANDFTVNALTWPRASRSAVNINSSANATYLADIIARRIIPLGTNSLKRIYRMIKLYRRGYTFGFGCPSDAIALRNCLTPCRDFTVKKTQNRTRELIRRAFTCDMSQPWACTLSVSTHDSGSIRDVSTRDGTVNATTIITTRYQPTVISIEYLQSMPEYKELTAMAAPALPAHDVHTSTVLTTSQAVSAYKVAMIPNKHGDKYVLVALVIPAGVRYINGGDITMYERAEIAGIYAYPNIRIDDYIHANKLNVVSSYDPRFHYATAGEIPLEIAATSGGCPAVLRADSSVGIYTYATVIDAWNHVSRSSIYHR